MMTKDRPDWPHYYQNNSSVTYYYKSKSAFYSLPMLRKHFFAIIVEFFWTKSNFLTHDVRVTFKLTVYVQVGFYNVDRNLSEPDLTSLSLAHVGTCEWEAKGDVKRLDSDVYLHFAS